MITKELKPDVAKQLYEAGIISEQRLIEVESLAYRKLTAGIDYFREEAYRKSSRPTKGNGTIEKTEDYIRRAYSFLYE